MFESLNKVFENRTRLKIMSILFVKESVSFVELIALLNSTDGNLNTHMGVLEKNCFVHVHKTFENRKPKTCFTMSQTGKKAFKDHIKALEELIKNTN